MQHWRGRKGWSKNKHTRNWARDYADLKARFNTVNGVKPLGVAKPFEINCDDDISKKATQNVGDKELDDGDFADIVEDWGGMY